MPSERHTVSPVHTTSRSAAGNTPKGGISRPAVIPPVQLKGERLTFTEMSIHSPGNSNTIAEVTLDGKSINKWKATGGEHAEMMIVEDLETKYLEELTAAKVMSLIINRAPCEKCAEALVKLGTKYKIAIRVKSTLITKDGEKGLPILNAANIPFRLFTIDQREGVSDNTRSDKRKWTRSKNVRTEADRVKGINNKRDLITASKDLSTDTGRREEEQVNIAKAKKAGYANAGLTWKQLGQSRATLAKGVDQKREEKHASRDIDMEGKSEEEDYDYSSEEVTGMDEENTVPTAVATAEKALSMALNWDWAAIADGRAINNQLTANLHQLINLVMQALPHYSPEMAERASTPLAFLKLSALNDHTTMNNLVVIPEHIGNICVALGVD